MSARVQAVPDEPVKQVVQRPGSEAQICNLSCRKKFQQSVGKPPARSALHTSFFVFQSGGLYVGPLAVSIMGQVDVPLTFWAPFVRCLNSLFVLFSMSSLLPVLGNSAYRILYQLRRRPSSSASLLFVFIRDLLFSDAQVGIESLDSLQ